MNDEKYGMSDRIDGFTVYPPNDQDEVRVGVTIKPTPSMSIESLRKLALNLLAIADMAEKTKR